MPNSTIRGNSCAIGWLQGIPPMSVPNAILTPAFTALRNDVSCSEARFRSRCPSGVSAGAPRAARKKPTLSVPPPPQFPHLLLCSPPAPPPAAPPPHPHPPPNTHPPTL